MNRDEASTELASLVERSAPMFEVGRIPLPSILDVNGVIVSEITSMAVRAAAAQRFDAIIDEDGNPMRTAPILDIRSEEEKGQLSLRYLDGLFNGISLDLVDPKNMNFHLGTDGKLRKFEDDRWHRVGRIQGRILAKALYWYEAM